MRHFIIASTVIVMFFTSFSTPSIAGTIRRTDVISGRPHLRTRTVGFYHRATPTRIVHRG
jgi:hypothetical protein